MPRELKPCGTVAAYKRHLKRGEKACEKCLAAKSQDERQKRAKSRVPEVAVPVPAAPESDPADLESELRWQADALKVALKWAAEYDPGKLPALAKERRETLVKLSEVVDADGSEGGELGGFLDDDQPLSIVRYPASEAREGA